MRNFPKAARDVHGDSTWAVGVTCPACRGHATHNTQGQTVLLARKEGSNEWPRRPGREQGRCLNFPKENREEGCKFVQENSRCLVWESPAELQTAAVPREFDVPTGLRARKLTVL